MMLKKIFFGACLIGGAAMAGSCSGTPNKAQSETDVAQEDATPEYIRLNCVYNVGEQQAAEAAELGRKLVAASQDDAGEMEYDMYESATRPGHFVIYETWKDQPSLDAHSASEHFTAIVPQMEAIAPLAVGRFEKASGGDTEGTQIRINCMMSAKEGETDALLDTAMKLVAASQSDAGMIDYDIYRSVTRPGHFMIFETWKDQPSLDAHSAADHFKTLVPRMHELSATSNADIFYF